MQYSYEIASRPVELGGGWRLRLLENDMEVGGGLFPVRQADPHQRMTWWDATTENERGQWLKLANSTRPVDAYQIFLVEDAFTDAENEAHSWLDTRAS